MSAGEREPLPPNKGLRVGRQVSAVRGKSPEVGRQKQGGKMKLLEGKTAQDSLQWSPSSTCFFHFLPVVKHDVSLETDLLSADFRFPPGLTGLKYDAL